MKTDGIPKVDQRRPRSILQRECVTIFSGPTRTQFVPSPSLDASKEFEFEIPKLKLKSHNSRFNLVTAIFYADAVFCKYELWTKWKDRRQKNLLDCDHESSEPGLSSQCLQKQQTKENEIERGRNSRRKKMKLREVEE